jgi:hypothetical protein
VNVHRIVVEGETLVHRMQELFIDTKHDVYCECNVQNTATTMSLPASHETTVYLSIPNRHKPTRLSSNAPIMLLIPIPYHPAAVSPSPTSGAVSNANLPINT